MATLLLGACSDDSNDANGGAGATGGGSTGGAAQGGESTVGGSDTGAGTPLGGFGGFGGSGGEEPTSTSSGGGPPCNDTGPGEPNSDESSAHELPDLDDDSPAATVSGVLAPGEEDWYVYIGTDTFGPGNVVDPGAEIIQGSSTARVCIFIECLSAELDDYSCPDETFEATSPQNRPGCCGFNEFKIGDINCNNTTSEDVRVYMRIDDVGGATCDAYELEYHY